MKYHSNLTTIFISMLVLLLFVATSVVIITEFNLTSPTLIVTEKILSDFAQSDGDVAVSFSSMERNLRDHVHVKDVVIQWKGEKLASFDTLEVKFGLLDLVDYLLRGRRDGEFIFEKGTITIPSTLLQGTSSENADSVLDSSPNNQTAKGQIKSLEEIELPKILEKYHVKANFLNFNLILGDNAEIQDLDAEFNFKGSLQSLEAAVYIPKLEFSLASLQGEVDYLGLYVSHEDTFVLKALADDVSFKSSYGDCHLHNASGKASLDSLLGGDYRKAIVSLALDNGSIASEEYGLDVLVTDFKGALSDEDVKASVLKVEGTYGETNISLEDVSGSVLDFIDAEVTLGSLSFAGFGIEGGANSLRGNYDLSKDHGSISLSSLWTNGLETYSQGLVSEGFLKDLSAAFTIKEPKLEISIGLEAKTEKVFERNLKGTISASLEKTEEGCSYLFETEGFDLGIGKGLTNLRVDGSLAGLSYALDYCDSLMAEGFLDLNDASLKGELVFKDFLPENLSSLLGSLYDEASNYLEAESVLDGQITYDLMASEEAYFKTKGKADYDLKLKAAHYNVLESDLNLKGSLELTDEFLVVPSLQAETSYVAIDCKGYFDFLRMLPDANLSLTMADGRELFEGSFNLGEGRTYSYSARIPVMADASFSGTLSLMEDYGFTESILKTGEIDRPFTAELDLSQQFVRLNSEKVSLNLTYSDGIDASLEFNSLDTVRNGYGIPIVLDGKLDLKAGKKKAFTLTSENLKVSSFWLIPGAPDIAFDIRGSQEGFWVDDLRLYKEDLFEYLGSGIFDRKKNSLVVGLTEKQGEGVMALSIYKDELYAGVLRLSDIDMGPFGLDGMVGNLSLAGRAVKLEDFSFSGNLSVNAKDSINDDRKITGKILLDNSTLLIEDIKYTSVGIDLGIETLRFDSPTGAFSMKELSVLMKGEHLDRDYPIELSLGAEGYFQGDDNLYLSVFNNIRSFGSGAEITLNLNKIDLDNSKVLVKDLSTTVKINAMKMEADGNLLSGTLDLVSKKASVKLDVMPIASFSAEVDFSDKIAANINLDGFNMYVMNLFFQAPLIVYDQDFLYGEIGLLQKEKDEFILSGNLCADELSLEIFWAPDQRLTLHNPRFAIWENEARSSLTPTTILDYTDYSRTDINTVIAFALNTNLSFSGYEAGLYTEPDKAIRVRIPLPDNNIDILGKVTGTYIFKSYDGQVNNDGYLNLMDTVVNIGMNPYPDWYGLTGQMFIDLGFNFQRNNIIAYPAGPNPMVSITIADNNEIFLHLGYDGVLAEGALNVRGGEIFYFNKYFYVLDGSVVFENPEKLDPKLSLRAALREFDQDGNKVEIYLVLKENSFDNLSPTFESAPAMELSEIMSILGQSILPEAQYGEISVTSVASLVTESIDVLSRMGVIKSDATGSNLNASIKKVFGLDTFSIHTNIVNNFVIGTLADVSSSRNYAYSPMARYLTGTTLNVGKYLSPDLYLQAMIHLDAGNDKQSYTVFADDLMIDAEVFLEWMPGPFNVTFFTTPKYASFYSVFETFGFTIKKTLSF